MLNKFGECAKLAVELLQNGKIKNPVLAWEKAAFFTFPNSSSSRKKCCPKNAFLTICETGRVKGVPAGIYCGDRVKENKNYALKIMDLLKNNSEFANNKQKLWKFVCGDSKISHNSQIDVVIGTLGICKK